MALPLLRHRQTRVLGALAGLLVIGAAAGLYPLWSNWDWHAPAAQPASPDVLAMVAQLEARMRAQPNDAEGWLMLGRSYLALERLDEAADAYDKVLKLDPNNRGGDVGPGRGHEHARGRRDHPAGRGSCSSGP